MTISENIRFFRKKMNFTQKQLSELSGIATITLQQYELGKRNPRIDNLQKIANALNIKLSDLVCPNETIKEFHVENGTEITNTLTKNQDGKLSKITGIKVYSNLTPECKTLEEALIKYFSMLNINGQREAVKRISELAEITHYTIGQKTTEH